MRRLFSILVLILVASSCSTDDSVIVGNESTTGQTSGPAVVDSPADDAQEEPVWNAPDADPVNVRLAPEDVLLPEDALGAPWEHQHRTLEAITYDAGPQQSDCADFWRAEQVMSQATANALWWRDGANLTHNVVPFDEFGLAESVLASAARVADACPVISWGEGGDYLVSPSSLDIDAFDGVETVSFLVDEGAGQKRWMVFSQRENLLSILSVPTWPTNAPPVVAADVADAASLAASRLAAAGDERPAPPTTTTTAPVTTTAVPETTVPKTTVPATTEPQPNTDAIVVDAVDEPDLDIIPDIRSSPELPVDLVAVLLDETDFAPGVLGREPDLRQYRSSDLEHEECADFAELDALLTVESELRFTDGGDVLQIVGRAPDSATAKRVVANFVNLRPCFELEFEADAQEAVERGDPEVLFSFTLQAVDVPGADAAVTLDVTDGEEIATVIVIAVDDLIYGASVASNSDGPENSEDLFIDSFDLATRAAQKIASAG